MDTELANRAGVVMSAMVHKFVELVQERKSSCKWLNDMNNHQALMNEAFTLIDHTSFQNRAELSEAFKMTLELSEKAIRERIAAMR